MLALVSEDEGYEQLIDGLTANQKTKGKIHDSEQLLALEIRQHYELIR